MAYPKITIPSANAIFAMVGIEIYQPANGLGYYEANVKGNIHSKAKLSDLVSELMVTYFKVPDQRQSPDASFSEVEPDYDEWQYLSEKRHVDAGIL